MQKRAAVYLRVSTTEQNTLAQRSELLEYVESQRWTGTVYEDQGHSGAKERRPGLDALLVDVRRRKVDVVVVWALDRLARSLKQLLALAEEFRHLGVDLVAVNSHVDTSSAAGILTYQVLGAVAEFERELLRERVKAGMQQARRAGKRIGRPANCVLSPADIVNMRALRVNGASVRSLARRHGITQFMVNKLCTD